ncbi:MAG: HAMP domain-containing histidine kinase [Acidobacteria bacterium]|nr:HAMP domain-containing histidine kinase [Acidobacteriota bacterium]MYJ03756.1 HAMP domain-containing histidine kinase [Acidobacteriota bacterium]
MSTPFGLWRRIATFTIVGALLLLGVGWIGEPFRFGASVDDTADRVEAQVRNRFSQLTGELAESAADVARHAEVTQRLGSAAPASASLFDLLASGGPIGLDVTVYDSGGTPRAWSGQPSEIALERLPDAALFITSGAAGLRLVHVEPISAPGDEVTPGRRLGSVAVERALSLSGGFRSTQEPALVNSPLAPVTLRPAATAVTPGSAAAGGSNRFVLEAPDGTPLLDVEVAMADLEAARAQWRQAMRRLLLGFVAAMLLVAALPELALAPRRTARQEVLRRTLFGASGLTVATALLWYVSAPAEPITEGPFADAPVVRSSVDVLLLSLFGAAIAGTSVRFVQGARFAWRTRPASSRGVMLFGHLVAGGLTALWFVVCDGVLNRNLTGSLVNLLDPTPGPWNPARLGVLFGLLVGASSAIWLGAQALVLADARWNRRRFRLGVAGLTAWILPPIVMLLVLPVPTTPYLAAVSAAIGIGLLSRRLRPRLRHASESGRLTILLACFVLPAILAYPSITHYQDAARRTFIEAEFAPAMARHPETLLASLTRARADIDDYLGEVVMPVPDSTDRPTPDAAFALWRETDLADQRLSSAIELYDAAGALASRFALNFPEYTATAQSFQATSCDWTTYGEVSPFGSQERRLLHAERAICGSPDGDGIEVGGRRLLGSVVVHVPLDYQSLPFISSASPYGELLRGPFTETAVPPRVESDFALSIYGWGLSPIFTSGTGAWTIDEELFGRIYASREPFWTTLRAGGGVSDVYISNDRSGIYAVGHRRLSMFDHAVQLAEIVAILGTAFLVWLIVLTLVQPFTRDRYRLGRELVRELRVSFYRRLFLAFVVVAVAPVLVLATIIRNYSTAELRADIEAGAAQTATTAQRVIDELEQAGSDTGPVVTDDLLVFVSQILDQDVHVYNGAQLLATSQRDLFASGLLPARTPAPVYSAIALAGAPSFVAEDRIGAQPYLVAAVPINSVGPDAILTIPLASQQQAIEQQITNLDRGILLGVTLLILLGAASGFTMAERIADPVQRLTRATRRIARGDFEARVATRSADELARLVGSFNRMAQDLSEQRRQLERTNRLEAWAEMARQVAHDIKNPLTPVQLSAEHLLRVHRDRGEPLGTVMRDCVDSILKQVRILRQISSDFSTYAISPPVAREPTSLAVLVADVVEPYRVGLNERIRLKVDVPPVLPALTIDRTLIARALTNVIENALHAMPGEGTLTIDAYADDGEVALRLEDDGIGLDEATLGRIFEPYFSTRTSGTGLGMAIAKRNVELNGGTIRVTSAKGTGTTVTLRFPAG